MRFVGTEIKKKWKLYDDPYIVDTFDITFGSSLLTINLITKV